MLLAFLHKQMYNQRKSFFFGESMNKTMDAILIFLCIVLLVLPILRLFALGEGGEEEKYTAVKWEEPYTLSFRGGYPRMTTVEGGLLLMVFEGSRELKYSTSADGKTWSTPAVAVSYKNTSYSPANPTPYYDEATKTTYLAYRCPITHDDSYEANIAYVTSKDNGKTWSEPFVVASSSVSSQASYGGMWEPTVYRIDGKLRVYYSCDTVCERKGQVTLNKGTVNERADDSFPFVSSKKYQNIVMHELDEASGEWSGGIGVYKGEDHLPYEPKGTNYQCRDGMQSISRLSDGTYVMAVETSKYNMAAGYGMTRYPMVIDVSFSRDGVSFTAPITVAMAPKADYKCAAPWVETLSDGRIAISFQTDDHLSSLPPSSDTSDRGQLKVIISKRAVTYEDAKTLTADDFEAFYPFEVYNSDVTYNYWNGIHFSGGKLYAMGNVSTKNSAITPSRGTLLAVFDMTETTPPANETDADATDSQKVTDEPSDSETDTQGTTAPVTSATTTHEPSDNNAATEGTTGTDTADASTDDALGTDAATDGAADSTNVTIGNSDVTDEAHGDTSEKKNLSITSAPVIAGAATIGVIAFAVVIILKNRGIIQ